MGARADTEEIHMVHKMLRSSKIDQVIGVLAEKREKRSNKQNTYCLSYLEVWE